MAEFESCSHGDIAKISEWATKCKALECGDWRRQTPLKHYEAELEIDKRKIHVALRWSSVPRPYDGTARSANNHNLQIDIMRISVDGRKYDAETAEETQERKSRNDRGHGTKFVLELMKIAKSVGRGINLEQPISAASRAFANFLVKHYNFRSYNDDCNYLCSFMTLQRPIPPYTFVLQLATHLELTMPFNPDWEELYQKGTWHFKPKNSNKDTYERGKNGCCHVNALTVAAVYRTKMVVGYLFVNQMLPIPLPHSANMDENGYIVDTTPVCDDGDNWYFMAVVDTKVLIKVRMKDTPGGDDVLDAWRFLTPDVRRNILDVAGGSSLLTAI